jgi:hypothetical protein
MMYIAFDNQIATLDDLIQSDIAELKKKDKEIVIKEWTGHPGADTTGTPECIIVHTGQLYAVSVTGLELHVFSRSDAGSETIARGERGQASPYYQESPRESRCGDGMTCEADDLAATKNVIIRMKSSSRVRPG